MTSFISDIHTFDARDSAPRDTTDTYRVEMLTN